MLFRSEEVLKPAMKIGRLKALVPCYVDSYSADSEPSVYLTANHQGQTLSFFLEFQGNEYLIKLLMPETLPDPLSALLQKLEFAQTEAYFIKHFPMSDIENAIFGLDQHLAAIGKSE